jgi:hypothetical protein
VWQVLSDPDARVDLESAVAALEGLEAALWPGGPEGSAPVGAAVTCVFPGSAVLALLLRVHRLC